MRLPTGTVTFLLTDIEGSTRLWEEHPEQMRQSLARRDSLAAEVVERHSGVLIKERGEGDSLFAVFERATNAVTAACALQLAYHAEPWPPETPLRERIALHTGEADLRAGDYFGSAVNRCARLRSIGHGGQVLLSAVTQSLCRDELPAECMLRLLGEHRLKDLARPETVFQLCVASLPAEFAPLRSLESMPNNLPQQVTSFIGREKELEEIRTLLCKTRLLTITGAGGCGKTRLALQAAADQLERSRDGVWLVELAALADPAMVPQLVASVLGLKEEPGRSLSQTVSDYLKTVNVLLVLDNCEHLLDASAKLADDILRSGRDVVILATSRERLGLSGELTYRVPSLSVPDPKQAQSPDTIPRYESARLLIERAQFHQPHFALTQENARAVASICYRLDGIPLAIELAAARVRSLAVEEIDRKLDQRFRLLTGGSRVAMPRQQTLRSLIDWSYDLLLGVEQALLRRLSVFADGWDLDAAEAVCTGADLETWQVLDILSQLVDKSLVIAEDQPGGLRYRLLETVRQYGREKLSESGEADEVLDRHRDWFLAIAEQADREIWGETGTRRVAQLEREHENLRAALESCRARGNSEAWLRLAGALAQFWYLHGHWSEGRVWLDGALACDAPQRSSARARALWGAGVLAWDQDDYVRARPLLEESLELRRELGEPEGSAHSMLVLGSVLGTQGDYLRARALLEESIALFRTVGARRDTVFALTYLGRVAFDDGDYAAARSIGEECLALSRDVGHRWGVAFSMLTLASIADVEGDYARASALCQQSLDVSRELGNRRGCARCQLLLGLIACREREHAAARERFGESVREFAELRDKEGLAYSFEACSMLAVETHKYEEAVTLLAAAADLRQALNVPLPPAQARRRDDVLAVARAALIEEAFAAASVKGHTMTLTETVDHAIDLARQ